MPASRWFPPQTSRGSLGAEGKVVPHRTRKISSALVKRAARIRLVLMDVDGVLTDSRILLHSMPDGTATEIKVFSAYDGRSEEHTSELQSRGHLVCRLLL